MNDIVEMRAITKYFALPSGEKLPILHGISLSIRKGEIIAIVGRSGSGKSTLLNILGLLDSPTSGSLKINGIDVTGLQDAKLSRLRGAFLGFVFQQFHLIDRRTALENVEEPLLFASRHELAHRSAVAASLLSKVGLADRMHSMPHLLSGGEQQRVAIARALVRQPALVLADEPTGALDAATAESVLEILFDLVREQQVTLVLVTHEEAIAQRADRVLALIDGVLQEMTS